MIQYYQPISWHKVLKISYLPFLESSLGFMPYTESVLCAVSQFLLWMLFLHTLASESLRNPSKVTQLWDNWATMLNTGEPATKASKPSCSATLPLYGRQGGWSWGQGQNMMSHEWRLRMLDLISMRRRVTGGWEWESDVLEVCRRSSSRCELAGHK